MPPASPRGSAPSRCAIRESEAVGEPGMSDLNRPRARRRAFTLVELPGVSRRKRAAFTLVELLVVIGIIALLIGILLPVLTKARRVAERTKCMSTLKQFGIMDQMYLNNYRDWHVPGWWVGYP